MALLRTCCCWKSVRRGSFASGVFTLIYFTIFFTTGMFTITSKDRSGEDHGPQTLMVLTVFLSGCCVLSSILLLVGLCVDSARLLLPWICFVSVTTLLEFVILFYMIGETVIDPVRASFLAVDLIVCALSVYGILCVVSQYQEYTAGRGRRDQQNSVATQESSVKYNSASVENVNGAQMPPQPKVVIKLCNPTSSNSHQLLLPSTPSATSSSVSRPSGAEVTSVSDRSPSPPAHGASLGNNPKTNLIAAPNAHRGVSEQHHITTNPLGDNSPEVSPDIGRRHSEKEPLLVQGGGAKKTYMDVVLRSHRKKDGFGFQKSPPATSTSTRVNEAVTDVGSGGQCAVTDL